MYGIKYIAKKVDNCVHPVIIETNVLKSTVKVPDFDMGYHEFKKIVGA